MFLFVSLQIVPEFHFSFASFHFSFISDAKTSKKTLFSHTSGKKIYFRFASFRFKVKIMAVFASF